jgi:hypothetical protein
MTMSLNNDYMMNIVAKQRLRDLHDEAAHDRLVRIALGDRRLDAGRLPWWRRLMAPAMPQQDASKDRFRFAQLRHHGLRIGAHHVAR